MSLKPQNYKTKTIIFKKSGTFIKKGKVSLNRSQGPASINSTADSAQSGPPLASQNYTVAPSDSN